jgi:hypothetical protein
MATRVDAANELETLKAQLADFALRNAAETIARDPGRFLSSDLMKAIEQSAIAAVEARLAREPRPSPEDFAEQVLMQIRPELAALMQGAGEGAARQAGSRGGRGEPRGGWDVLMRELKRYWATVAVVALLIAAIGGLIGYFAGVGVERASQAQPPAFDDSADAAPPAAPVEVTGQADAGPPKPTATGAAAAPANPPPNGAAPRK